MHRLGRPGVGDAPAYYYATLFHELAHSTAHESRLGRPIGTSPFGSPAYAKEELIAELTAAFLCGTTGIAPVKVESISETGEVDLLGHSAAYIDHWRQFIEDDPKPSSQRSRPLRRRQTTSGDKPMPSS